MGERDVSSAPPAAGGRELAEEPAFEITAEGLAFLAAHPLDADLHEAFS